MNTITLPTLTSDIRVAAMIRDSQHFTDAQILRLLNASIYAFTGRLVGIPGCDYFETTTSLATAAGTALYSFSSDVFDIKKITYAANGVETKLKRFSDGDYPVDSTGLSWDLGGLPAFRVVGDQIRVIPTPTSIKTLTLYYVPLLPDCYNTGGTKIARLSASTDYINDRWGFSDWIILDVACKIIEEQQEDSRQLRQQQSTRWEEIKQLVMNRNQYSPKRIPRAKSILWGSVNED